MTPHRRYQGHPPFMGRVQAMTSEERWVVAPVTV